MPPLSSRLPRPLLVLALLSFSLQLGCGNTVYLVKVNSAEERFIQAKQMGAEQLAPYEYYGAKARLEEAKHQAAEGEYGNAATLADESDELSFIAAKKCRLKRDPTRGKEQ